MQGALAKDVGPLRPLFDEGLLILEFSFPSQPSFYACPAYMNLTTKYGSFLLLQMDDDPLRQHVANLRGQLCLTIADNTETHGFKLITQTFDTFNLKQAVHVTAWRLVLGDTVPNEEFCPGNILVERVGWKEKLFGGGGLRHHRKGIGRSAADAKTWVTQEKAQDTQKSKEVRSATPEGSKAPRSSG